MLSINAAVPVFNPSSTITPASNNQQVDVGLSADQQIAEPESARGTENRPSGNSAGSDTNPNAADSGAIGNEAEAEEQVGNGEQEQETEGENTRNLTQDQLQEVAQLASRDREVRAHEQAHAAVGGRYAGSPSYEYTQGPDSKRYATGGEVPIDVSPVADNPQATIQKMTVVIRAALAPAEPSSQDRRVAASAAGALSEARSELARIRSEELRGEGESEENSTTEQSSNSTNETRNQADEQQSLLQQRIESTGAINQLIPEGLVVDQVA